MEIFILLTLFFLHYYLATPEAFSVLDFVLRISVSQADP